MIQIESESKNHDQPLFIDICKLTPLKVETY